VYHLPSKNVVLCHSQEKRWEMLPNRREPFTPAMLEHLSRSTLGAPPDSLDIALRDWYAVGLNAGCVAQNGLNPTPSPSSYPPMARCPWLSHAMTSGFSMRIVVFCHYNRWRMGTNSHILCVSDGVSKKTTTTAKQRHSRQTLVSPRVSSQPCFALFSAPFGFDCPLAVFDSGLLVKLIADTHITTSIRQLAVAVYGPMSPEALQRFSSHSLRVGACVILHANGKNEVFIKQRLRWRSDSFMNYLRDVPILALEHAMVLRRSQLGHIAPTLLD
jgi:hypothetical protein